MQNSVATPYNYLQFVDFVKFNTWDVQKNTYVNEFEFDNAVSLSEILTIYRKSITHEEVKENQLRIIKKIDFGGNLFLREFNELENYKGKLYLVPENSVIFSKINVRHGCIYYNNSKPFTVSNEYPCFTFDPEKVDGEYLILLLRSTPFKEQINTLKVGIGKARVKVEEFLGLQIPLPPIEKQKALVKDYQENLNYAEKLEHEILNLEQESEDILLKKLGLELQFDRLIEKGKLNLIEFKELGRWDVWNTIGDIVSNKYDLQKFEDVITGKPVYGANVRGVKRKSETRYIRITDINEDGSLNDEFVSPEKVEEKYLLKENDFLIARSGNTVGKTFLYKQEYGRCIYAGYLVKYNLGRKILPEFLLYYTKGKAFKHWVSQNQRVSGQPNINGQEYLQFPIPVPPLEKQKEIVSKISANQQIIMQKKQEYNNLKEKAIMDFENTIFNSAN